SGASATVGSLSHLRGLSSVRHGLLVAARLAISAFSASQRSPAEQSYRHSQKCTRCERAIGCEVPNFAQLN
ncbi:MAG TPA: hypothetical protein PLL90_03415, partial [Bacteroidales bacterium]|nr:hypothetical protein [Bacteroidales bacterium]